MNKNYSITGVRIWDFQIENGEYKKHKINLIGDESVTICTKDSLDGVVDMLTKENYTILYDDRKYKIAIFSKHIITIEE